jgi:ornithine cyclodeaminase/alanine dehydrogenase-like protein (mu-crystallin family)
MNIPFLSEHDLEALNIKTGNVVEAIEQAIKGSEEGTVWSAPKAVMLPEDGRYMMAALAASDNPQILAVKTVVMNPRNVDRGIPQINGLVTLLNSETGFPAAVMDGNWITAVRTAGLSAVAAKYLANPDSSVAAFLGTGVQAKSHLQVFHDLFPVEHIKIFGRGRPNIDRLAEMAEGLGLSWEVSDGAQDAMRDADLIATSISYSTRNYV